MSATPFSLRLDPALRARLEDEARRLDRPASQVAGKAIAAWLDARATKRQAIEEALADAEAGVFVSGEAMAAWMDSWDGPDEQPAPAPDIHPPARRR